MRQRGESTDMIVMEEIRSKPGVTVSEIANNLGWTNGKVDGSVNRLVSKGMASVKHCLRRGALLKIAYPADFVKQERVIEIPREIVDEGLWQDSVFAYFLSRSTIGLATHEIEEWNEKALLKKRLKIEKNGARMILRFPEKFSDFYQLSNSEVGLSAVGNLVLVTIESMLPVKLPVEYLEETRYAFPYYGMGLQRETAEGVSPLNVSWVQLTKGEQKGIIFRPEPYVMKKRRTSKKILEQELLSRATSSGLMQEVYPSPR